MKFPFGQSQEAKIAAFWDWFQSPRGVATRNELGDPATQNGAVGKIADELKKIRDGLCFGVLGAGCETSQLEIGAGGTKEFIPIARAVVAAAPPIENWTVVAFKQPLDGGGIRYRDQDVDRDSVLCRFHPESRALEMYLPLPADAPHNLLAEIGFILLDHTLGEYVCMTEIGQIDFNPSVLAPPDAKPLRELAERFQSKEQA